MFEVLIVDVVLIKTVSLVCSFSLSFLAVACLQMNRQRVYDRFKNREDSFFDKLEDDLFPDLYSMRDHAYKSHLLVVKWELELPKWNFQKGKIKMSRGMTDGVL